VCTLIVLHRVHPDFPLVLAGNRDEAYAREATPPRLLREEPRLVGGLDLAGGGTWLGLTPEGVIAAVTNQRAWHEVAPAPRSRGQVVLDVLAAASHGATNRLAAARDALDSIDPRAYNSFNLLVADPTGVLVAYARRDRGELKIEPLPPGVFVLANDRLGSSAFPKQRRGQHLVAPYVRAPWPELEARLASILADHHVPEFESLEPPPPGARFTPEVAAALQAICIHLPGYGTRSASIAALHPEGVAHYLYADGPPCEAAFDDFTELLR
jgi:uncharacterized protein with NRDE domain